MLAWTCASALVLGAGCRSPLDRDSESALTASVAEALRRQIADAEARPALRTLERESRLADLEIRDDHLEIIAAQYSLEGYLAQLAEAADPDAADPIQALLAADLYGGTQRVVAISLERCVAAAVANNLDVEFARFGPAISESQVIAAEAAFDWQFLTSVTWSDQEIPQPGQIFTGGAVRTEDETINSTTTLSRSLTGGGLVGLTQRIDYADQRSSFFGAEPIPNPANTVAFDFEIDQPLLRGFGSESNLAQVRLSRNAERAAIADLRRVLIDRVTETEQAYWELVKRYNELVIRSKLLERGIQVRDDIRARRVQDARQAQVADAVARVERRRGDLLRSQTALRRASDRLKALINDPQLPVGAELLLLPVDAAIDEPIDFSLADSITRAAANRPELELAVLDIDDASIRQQLARNLSLPQLDLQARMTLIGLDSELGDAYSSSVEDRFVDSFLLGAVFSQPIGNRAGNAEFRSARLERMQSVVGYRRAVQAVVLEVKEALDAVVTNYKLIEQAKLTRIAQSEALRTLAVEKQLTERGYTVERLNLELNQQESLAAAEFAQISAVIDYNASLADMHRAMGTTLQRNRIDFVVPDANQVEPGNRALDYDLDSGG